MKRTLQKIYSFSPRRMFIQLFFLIVQNPFINNFLTGKIYRGGSKAICVPSLHCYSCPSAPFSCPIGTIQYVIKYAKMVPYFAIGTLVAVGTLFGSASCGYFCPFGFFQDLIYKISPFKSKKKLPFKLRYTKWVMLLGFVLILPIFSDTPPFCAYICPAGTLGAGIPLVAANEGLRASAGLTFIWKLLLLVGIILYAMREERAFCRYLCPLGLILGLFNRISFFQIKLKTTACRSCTICHPTRHCPMGLQLPEKINSIDCIKCGECIQPCPFNAIDKEWNFMKKEHVIDLPCEKDPNCKDDKKIIKSDIY